MRALLPALVLFCSAAACTVKEGRAPVAVPEGISIAVTLDGVRAGTLDSAWLDAHAPDFRDGDDRRAWKISSIAGPNTDASGSVIEVLSGDGAARLKPGRASIAFATLNRSGELVVALADPSDPFPAFHGRGGNRGHAGAEARVRGVIAIHVTSPAEPAR